MLPDAALIQPDAHGAPAAAQLEIMRSQHHHAGALNEILDPRFGLAHEMRVAGQDPFIHQQYFRLEARRDRKSEPQYHSRRIGPHRHVEVIAEFGEFDDVRQVLFDRAGRQPEQKGSQANVLIAAQICIDSDTDVEHRGNPPVRDDTAFDGLVDSRHGPQQRGLSGAVGPDQRQPISRRQRKGNLAQRLDNDLVIRVAPDLARRSMEEHALLQGTRTSLVDRKRNRYPVQADDRLALSFGHHRTHIQ